MKAALEQENNRRSFDFKLIRSYILILLFTFPLAFFIPEYFYFASALFLLAVFTSISVQHKRKNGWHWIRPERKHIINAIVIVLSSVGIIYVVSVMWNDELPSAWILFFAGISYFNIAAELNLADRTEKQFNERKQVREEPIEYSTEEPAADKHKRTRIIVRIFFYVIFCSVLYLFYSIHEYSETWSHEPTSGKTVTVESHGQTYYVNEYDQRNFITKMLIIVPAAFTFVITVLVLKYRFGVNLNDRDSRAG